MKIYAPDINNDGNFTVKFYRKGWENCPAIEYHTDNPRYADIYFDAITAVIKHSDLVNVKYDIEWRRIANLYSTPIKPKAKPNPWDDIKLWGVDKIKAKKCPFKYKDELVKWVMKEMRWNKTKAKSKSKWELKKIWYYKNQKGAK